LLHRVYFQPKIPPNTLTSLADPENVSDYSDSTYASEYVNTTDPSGIPGIYYGYSYLYFSVPNLTFENYSDRDFTVTVKYRGDITSESPVAEMRIKWDGGDTAAQGMTLDGAQRTLTFTISESPVPTNLRLYVLGNDASVAGEFALKLYSVKLYLDPRINTETGDPQAAAQARAGIKTLYSGADGLTRNWTTGPVTEIHELHRDLLHRWGGYTTEPTGWTDLDTARSGWLCRWWAHKPVELEKALEQAQYEGCFIFMWGPTGVGRYIWVKASYSSGDVAATIDPDADVRGLVKYSHTPFDELLTKQVISYERHPADEGRYLSTHTQTNSTARTNWNIQTAENVAQVELDMLVAEVDTHAEYYENIFGDLKTIIQFEVVRPALLVLEVGDIIQLSGSAVYYMVTDERRSPGKLSLTAREVG